MLLGGAVAVVMFVILDVSGYAPSSLRPSYKNSNVTNHKLNSIDCESNYKLRSLCDILS